MQPVEFNKMVKGYERRQRILDTNKAFWVANIMNTQLAKGKGVEPKDFIDILYPMTALEKKQLEEQFIKEFRAEGGEI